MPYFFVVLSASLLVSACGEEEKSSATSETSEAQQAKASSPEEEVKATLELWCQAQTDGDFAAYSALYAEGFKGIKKSKKKKAKTYDLKGWLKDRGRMFKKPLHVDCKAPKVSLGEGGKSASVTFEQYWRSPTYADQGDKRLDLVKKPAGWMLVGEEMLKSDKWDTKSFRDGTPAPKATFKTDETKVKIPSFLKEMTTRQGPPCYRKCLKTKPKNWREVITTNHDFIRYPSKDGCEKYCIEMHGNYE